MNILDVIIEQKLLEIALQSVRIPLSNLISMERSLPLVNFKEALDKNGVQIIAEVKLKSPSEGEIQDSTDVLNIAKEYEKNGAAAISVLTDKEFFGGSLDFLTKIKEQVKIPILRKDFVISEYQVYESYLAGADAILLIAEALDKIQFISLYKKARDLGMDVLVEFHSEVSLNKVLEIEPDIFGVNSRNLETMKVNISWFEKMAPNIPQSAIKVAESGIKTSSDLDFVSQLGYDAALIGTSLMKSESPGKTLKKLLKETAK